VTENSAKATLARTITAKMSESIRLITDLMSFSVFPRMPMIILLSREVENTTPDPRGDSAALGVLFHNNTTTCLLTSQTLGR
jgi:hypothetical protein